jgi:formylglycine-generating enzyme required for sulfatase activity
MELVTFLNLSLEEREIEIKKIAVHLADKFDLIALSDQNNLLPTFVHRQSNIEFKYIPAGNFNMGLSKREELSAKKIFYPVPANFNEMRPVKNVEVNEFLISSLPILNKVAERFVKNNKYQKDPNSPSFLTRSEAESLANQLECRIPEEKEWEYICRATTQTLFVFGDELPEEKELSQWLSWDFSHLEKVKSNFFGIYGLFTGEWCQDKYKASYDENEKIDHNAYVIRGGGALFWPWQDQEWVWCMSAMRTSSHDIIDGKCGLRLAYDIAKTVDGKNN